MPGLFGIETPEEVRAKIGRSGREQDLNLAQLPVGRGRVALASQQGRGVGQGVSQLLGAPTEAQSRKQKTDAIQQSIRDAASARGITKEKQPLAFLGITANVLLENGEVQAASNAVAFGNKLKSLTRIDDTSITKEVKQQFNIPPDGNIADSPEASKRLRELQSMRTALQREARGDLPDTTPATSSDRTNNLEFISEQFSKNKGVEVDGTVFDSSDISAGDRRSMSRELSELMDLENRKNRKRKAAPLDQTVLRQQKWEQLKQFLEVVPGDFFSLTKDIKFNRKALARFLKDREQAEEVVRKSRSDVPLKPIGEFQ